MPYGRRRQGVPGKLGFVGTQLRSEEIDALRDCADQQRRPVANLIRQLISQHVQDNHPAFGAKRAVKFKTGRGRRSYYGKGEV
jgi:hypothetical protein